MHGLQFSVKSMLVMVLEGAQDEQQTGQIAFLYGAESGRNGLLKRASGEPISTRLFPKPKAAVLGWDPSRPAFLGYNKLAFWAGISASCSVACEQKLY